MATTMGGAVAGRSAHAVLVEHRTGAPVEGLSDLDHGAGQRRGFAMVQLAGAGRDEGRQLMSDRRFPTASRIRLR